MAELKRGTLLKGRYRIEQVIGRGAMGAVYLARDEVLAGATWALKVLCEADVPSTEVAEAVALFRREADMCARLRHPGLAEIIDAFSENGCHVLVMERIQGETLEDIVEQRKRPLTEAELLPLLIQLAACLQYLHQQYPHPVIYRDLKPSNCMVTPSGKLTLIDFGIARYHKPGRKSDTIVIGTPGFCAPEQYGASQTEPRSDIYSLGATAWHLLSGEDPASLGFAFPPLRQVAPACSETMEAIIARCVSFSVDGRYPSAAELLADLRWAQSRLAPQSAPRPRAWRAAATRTNKLQRIDANQHLSRVAADSGGSVSAVFSAVRTADAPSTRRRIDAAFLRRCVQQTFRVWWGAGSIHLARVLALFLVVLVLNQLARVCMEGESHTDRCTAALNRNYTVLADYQAEHGRFPDDDTAKQRLDYTHCPTTGAPYRYEVSKEGGRFTVTCSGRHPSMFHPQLDARGSVSLLEDRP